MANTIFSQKEVEYLKSQRLARIARASVLSEEEGEGESDTEWNPTCMEPSEISKLLL